MTREEYYCNEFLEKIYYFCLKKNGDVLAAEDLSSEISMETYRGKVLLIGVLIKTSEVDW